MTRLRVLLAGLIVGVAVTLGGLVLPGRASAAPRPTTAICIPAAVGVLPCIATSQVPAAPTPGYPGDGLSGLVDPTPARGTTKYAVQGYAPLHFSLYDEGTLGESRHPLRTFDNGFGGFLFSTAVFVTALGNGLQRLVSPPTFLNALDSVISNSTSALYDTVWAQYAPLAIVIVGIGVLVGVARRRDLATAFNTLGWVVGVLALVAWVVVASVQIGHAADRYESGAVSQIDAGIDGQKAVNAGSGGSLVVDDVLYPMWLEAELGSSTSAVAVKDGPKLYQASGYTWAETKNGTASPSASTTHHLEDEWQSAAADVKAHDPAAYDHLTDATVTRTGIGFVAVIAAALTTGFRVVAFLLVVASLLILRVAVIVVPVIAVIAINPRFDKILRDLLGHVASALISAIVFSVGAAIDVLATGVLLSPTSGIGLFPGIVLTGVVTGTLWWFMRPYRKLTALVGLADARGAQRRTSRWANRRRENRGYDRQAGMIAAEVGAAALGGVAGLAVGAAVEHHVEAQPSPTVQMYPGEVHLDTSGDDQQSTLEPSDPYGWPSSAVDVDVNPLDPAVAADDDEWTLQPEGAAA